MKDSTQLDQFLITNSKYFEARDLNLLSPSIERAIDTKWPILRSMTFKDPTMLLVISVVVGSLGIDRFLLGQSLYGVLKLITLGGCGVWTIVDWFLIMGLTKEKNKQDLIAVIN